MSLYSKRFSGVEILNDGKTLILKKKNSSLFTYFDNLNSEVNIKGNVTSNSLTFNENEGIGNDKIKLKAPILEDSYTLTLPSDKGNEGDVLGNNGSGCLLWQSTSGSGVSQGFENNIQLKYGINFTGNNNLSFNGKILTVSNNVNNKKGNIFMTPQIDSVYSIPDATEDSVHIGRESGLNNSNNYSISIGYEAGKTFQGTDSIAIGHIAGSSNQGDNSIIINASGSDLSSTDTNSFFVKPIKSAGALGTGTSGTLIYDYITGEIKYSED